MKAQAEAESRPPIYNGKWAKASAEEVEQEKAKASGRQHASSLGENLSPAQCSSCVSHVLSKLHMWSLSPDVLGVHLGGSLLICQTKTVKLFLADLRLCGV